MAKAARNLAKNGAQSLPPELDRSKLIQTLSVFISQVESISGPGEPNYDIYVRACREISTTLDELLNPSSDYPDLTQTTFAQSTELNIAGIHMTASDPFSSDIWDGIDLSSLAPSVDWTAMCDEWAVF